MARSRFYSIAFYTTVILLILIVGLILATALQPLLVLKFYKSAVNELSAKTGVNEYLLRAIVLPISVIFVILGIMKIFSRKKPKRRLGLSIIVIIIVLFNLFIWVFTINAVVKDGVIYRWTAYTQNGWALSETPGEAVEYDVPYLKITKTTKKYINNDEPPPAVVFKPKQEDFFDTKTGKGKVWFEVDEDGKWIFYKYPGFSVRSGVWLNRMTPEYFQKYIGSNNKVDEAETVYNDTDTLIPSSGSSEEKDKQVRPETYDGPPRILILIDERNLGKRQEESIIASKISEKLYGAQFAQVSAVEIGKNNTERIRQFIDKGNLHSLKNDFYNIVDIVIWGNVNTRYGSSNLGKYESCHATGVIKAISLNSGSVIAVQSLDEKGFGETKDNAGINALINAGKKVADAFINQIGSYKE